jgi:agmatinase
MLFYTENVLKFAFSIETSAIDTELHNPDDKNIFGILGVPFDGTTSYMPGARFGPRSVREASYNFERYNLFLDKTLNTEVYDFGDLEVVHGNFKKTCLNLKTTISEILDMGLVPLTIGGDHSISYCILKAMEENDGLNLQNITIIYFDAHMDLRNLYMGDKYSHATVMHRIFDMDPKDMIQIGVRSSSEEEVTFAREKNLSIYTSYDVDEKLEEIITFLKNIKGPIYLSIDIDVLDPAYAPSVGTPSSCGLNPKQVEKLIYSLKGKKIVGFDIVEVSSTSIGDITSLNAAKIIYDVLFLQ